jgi:hypothetical protein
LDPAAGNGDLLLAAADRIAALGGIPTTQLFGAELHGPTVNRLRKRLAGIASATNLLHGDFFAVADGLGSCDAIVANPPYVRHHDIPVRRMSSMRASLNGNAQVVEGKASAWAYFVAHAPTLLRAGGRAAFVLPAEVLSADYSTAIVQYLATKFNSVQLVYCNGDVFPRLNQKIVLCLADGYRADKRSECTPQWTQVDARAPTRQSDIVPWSTATWGDVPGGWRLPRLLASPGAIKLNELLSRRAGVRVLGEIASVGIGYVTGGNEFFHLSESDRQRHGLHARHLTKALPSSGDARGASFGESDWEHLRASGRPCWLLTPKHTRDVAVQRILRKGRLAKVHRGYKCENRENWWKVPLRAPAPAFMGYTGSMPTIRENGAGVAVSNSLFELSALEDVSARSLALGSITSVFQLSALLNARVLGGGLRKLEPSDVSRASIPVAEVTSKDFRRVDALLRSGNATAARLLADQIVLKGALGWTDAAIADLQDAGRD